MGSEPIYYALLPLLSHTPHTHSAYTATLSLHTQQPTANFVVVQNNLGKWRKIFLPTNFRGVTASFPPSPSPSPSTSVSSLESSRCMFDLCTRIVPSEIFDLIKDNFEKLTRIEGDSDGSGLHNAIKRLDESERMAPGDPGAGEPVDGHWWRERMPGTSAAPGACWWPAGIRLAPPRNGSDELLVLLFLRVL